MEQQHPYQGKGDTAFGKHRMEPLVYTPEVRGRTNEAYKTTGEKQQRRPIGNDIKRRSGDDQREGITPGGNGEDDLVHLRKPVIRV